jgi:hypothetical protein
VTPVQIIFVPIPVGASNKRVRGRPPLYEPSTRRDPWLRNHQPIPAEIQRHLDDARKEIVRCRPAITRELNAARRELVRCQPEIQRFLYGGSDL